MDIRRHNIGYKVMTVLNISAISRFYDKFIQDSSRVSTLHPMTL